MCCKRKVICHVPLTKKLKIKFETVAIAYQNVLHYKHTSAVIYIYICVSQSPASPVCFFLFCSKSLVNGVVHSSYSIYILEVGTFFFADDNYVYYSYCAIYVCVMCKYSLCVQKFKNTLATILPHNSNTYIYKYIYTYI